jgi:hypothetical protein
MGQNSCVTLVVLLLEVLECKRKGFLVSSTCKSIYSNWDSPSAGTQCGSLDISRPFPQHIIIKASFHIVFSIVRGLLAWQRHGLRSRQIAIGELLYSSNSCTYKRKSLSLQASDSAKLKF